MIRETVTPNEALILVVEDDPNNRLVITRLLKLSGVRPENVAECDSDPTVLIPDRLGDFDLIFLDLQLPRKDGYAIITELKAMPALAGTKIVALTANVMRQDIERAKTAGFDGFVGKPIDGRKFSEIITKILAGESVWTVQ
nr:response regulator [Spirochaetota bacterium]